MLFVIMRELLDTSLTSRSGFTLILFISVTSYMNVDAVSSSVHVLPPLDTKHACTHKI